MKAGPLTENASLMSTGPPTGNPRLMLARLPTGNPSLRSANGADWEPESYVASADPGRCSRASNCIVQPRNRGYCHLVITQQSDHHHQRGSTARSPPF